MKIKVGIGVFFLCCTATIQAQIVTGRVTDVNNNPVELAVIVAQSNDSVYLNAVYTDSLGCFSIETKMLPCVLIAQHLMYETCQLTCSAEAAVAIEMPEKDLMLSEILVKGERPLVKVVDGRMTYDMPQLLQNKMAVNAYEAILELPGVQNLRGGIELAGANKVTVVINGKVTNMGQNQLENLLKSMPKERIEKAEIMYTAPPQYHVRGAVINLVLKSGESDGERLQGQVNGLFSQGHYSNYQLGAMLAYNTPKFSTDLMYSFGFHRTLTGQDIVSNHLYDGEIYKIEQRDRGFSKRPVHTIRLGQDWLLGDKEKIRFAYTSEIEQRGTSFTSSEGTISDSENWKKADQPIQMHNIMLGYDTDFGLSVGGDFTYYMNHTTQHYQERKEEEEDGFKARADQDVYRYSLYLDQTHQLAKDWSLNYGTKFSFASDRSSQVYQALDAKDWSASDSYSKLDEYVYDLYGGFSKKVSDRLSLSASLTAEYYKRKDVDYWSLFPTAEVTFVARPDQIWQLSVSSDKAYPSYWEMQNAISYLSGYAEIQGNPNLTPSKTYSSQLNYILKNKYIFTLYANYVDDNINQLPYQASDRLVLIYQTLNFDYTARVGANMILPFKIGSLVNSRLTLNGFFDKAKSKHFHDIGFDKRNVSFYAGLDNTFNISSKPDIKAELSCAYISRSIQGPMEISSMYNVDAGVKWTFYNGNAILSLKANDLFNSWVPKELELRYKTQDLMMRMVPDSRRVSMSFVYKFGGFKERKHKEVDKSRFGK